METGGEVTGPFNLGNPDEFTILELAEKIIALTGSKSKIEFRPLPADDPKQRQPNITRARDVLGWSPKVKLAEGLEKSVAYFEQMASVN
jgi:UDP-glucuronate decarboxylase